MIDWIKYDPYSREIEPNVYYLVTDGTDAWIARHAKNRNSGYSWFDGRYILNPTITHWAKINLPEDAQS